MSWFNKNKIVVDTKYNRERDRIWTLINNETRECKDFHYARWVMEELIAKDSDTRAMIDEMIRKGVDKELDEQRKEKFNKHFTFHLNKDVAPLFINKMDAMECVGQWEIEQSEMFPDMVRVKYYATKQVLFQTSNGVALKED